MFQPQECSYTSWSFIQRSTIRCVCVCVCVWSRNHNSEKLKPDLGCSATENITSDSFISVYIFDVLLIFICASFLKDFSPHQSRSALGTTHPCVRWVPGLLGLKQSGRDVDHPPSPSAEIKNEWSYNPTFFVVPIMPYKGLTCSN